MKALAIAMITLLMATFSHANTEFTVEEQLRAEAEKSRFLLNELRKLKNAEADALFSTNKHRPRHCDDDDVDDRYYCVKRCKARMSDGRCISYAQDFCGRDASCSPNCKARMTDGRCISYNEDFCGENANCAKNCKARTSDGRCISYGPDICY